MDEMMDEMIAQTGAAQRTLSEVIESQSWLDQIAQPIQQPLFALLERFGGLRSVLNGTWLGHPVHAAVTDLPVGAFATGFIFDLLDALGVRRDLRRASDAVHAAGVSGALAAALFGLADWTYTSDRPRRVGLVHGLTNVAIAGIYGASLAARGRGARATGTALSMAGFGMLLFSTWLGGELSYRHGVGVSRRAFEPEPEDWVRVLDEVQLHEDELRRVEARGTPLLLTRHRGEVYAIGDTCTHMGCSLSEGQLDGDVVTCPCHGSRFRVTDGQVVQGPATVPEPSYDVRLRGGYIEVRERRPAERGVRPAA